MTPTEILFLLGVAVAVIGFVTVLASKRESGSVLLFAMLCGGFSAYTAVQIWQEGILMFWTNHSQNMTGIQVWWDLILAVLIALFFIAPRARKAGMNVPLWGLLVISTASIGLTAMCARLFWLESRKNPA
jgi:hypothetical protein